MSRADTPMARRMAVKAREHLCVCADCVKLDPSRIFERERRHKHMRADVNIRGPNGMHGEFAAKSIVDIRRRRVHMGWADFGNALRLLDSCGLHMTERKATGEVPGFVVVAVEDKATGEPRGTRTLVLDRAAKRWRVEA